MVPVTAILQAGLVETAVDDFLAGVADALPLLAYGALFLVSAYAVVRFVLALLRGVLERVLIDEPALVADLVVLVVAVVLWFVVALMLLSVLGFGDIAAGLGAASGFVALGVAYAVSDALADVVAGVYLARDDDFGPGKAVVVAETPGVVSGVDLRKSRMELASGDTEVIRNQDVEKRWTNLAGGATAVESLAAAADEAAEEG